MITNLQLKNFTAFTDLSIDFSPGINIVLGENGTGKAQLLKSILVLCGPEAYVEQAGPPLSGQVGELRRAGALGEPSFQGVLL